MSKEKTEEAEEKDITPLRPKKQTAQAVVVPVDVWSEVLDVLQTLPYKDVGRLMIKCSQLPPQQVEVRPE